MAQSAKVVLQTVIEGEEDVEDFEEELRELDEQAEETEDALSIDADTSRARESIGDLDSDIQNVESEVRALRRQLRILGQTEASPEVDVDREGAGRGRLPGELDEVGDAVRFVSQLRTETVLAGGALATLTAGLAGVGGLSAAALKAADSTTVLNEEMAQLKARGRETAREFAQEFAPTLQQDVLPALNRTLAIVQVFDDELSSATGSFFDFLQRFRGTATPLGIPAAVLTSPEGEGVTGGGAARIGNVVTKVQSKLGKAQDRFELRKLFGLPPEERIQTRISTLEKLRDKLINTLAAVDQSKVPPSAVARINREIQEMLDRLDKARGALRRFKINQRLGSIGAAQAADPAGTVPNQTRTTGEILQDFELVGSMRELGNQAQQAGQEIDEGVNQTLVQGINLASQLGSTLVQSAKQGGASFQQIFGSVLQTIGGVVGVANPALGAGIAGTGTIVQQLQHGGEVNTPLQVVGERGPELAALPKGTQVMNNTETRDLLGQERVVQKLDEVAGRIETLDVQLSAFEAGAEIGRSQGRLERAGDRIYPAKG